MERRINWFGLAAGIITLIVLVVSLFVPWWQLTIGDKLLQVNASPLNTNFGLLDLHFTVPLLWAWNLVSVLIFAAAGVVMLVYSIFPTRSYSKELLGFSYKKPLYILISFFIGLLIMIAIAGAALCIVARLYHGRVAQPSMATATATMPPPQATINS